MTDMTTEPAPEPLHETHVCRDCAAEITLPYATPSSVTPDLRAELARLSAIEYEAHQWHDAIRRGDFGSSTCACNRADGTRCSLGAALASTPPLDARTAALDEVESAVIRLDNEQFRSGRVGTRAVLAAIAALRGGSPNA